MTSQTLSRALDALTSQWSDALSELDSSGVAMIAQLLEGDATYGEVRMRVEESGAGWRVGVSADARANALPLISGLLTSNGFDIRQADIFTIGAATRPTDGATRRQSPRRPISPNFRRRRRPNQYATRGTQRRVAMLFELTERSDVIPELGQHRTGHQNRRQGVPFGQDRIRHLHRD